MTNAMIKDAIKTADFESGLLDDTDEPELHRRNILTIHMMKDDFEEFQFHHVSRKSLEEEITPNFRSII